MELRHVRLAHHGTVVTLTPLHATARRWLEDHTDGAWWGRALVVEPRYLDALLTGLDEAMHEEGL